MKLAVRPIFSLIVVIAASLVMSAQVNEDQNGVTVNRNPLRDFESALIRKLRTENIEFNKPFRIEVEATPDTAKGNSFRTRVVKSEGDERLVGVVGDAVAAVGASGFLGYLTEFDAAGKLMISVSQTAETFSASIVCPASTAAMARANASSVSMLFTMAAQVVREENPGGAQLLKDITAAADGLNYTITFATAALDFQKWIKAELGKSVAK